MYQLKYKDYILHDMRLADEKLIIRDPSVKLAVSKAGEMSFTVDAEHPYLSNLRRMSGLVELLDGTFPIYRGRITTDTKDFYGAHKIETEGIMAALNDSIIKPFSFPEDFKDDDDYKAAAASGNVVDFFFRWILAQHNSQVSTEQQIKPGVCTVTDSNNYITRSASEYATAMSTISDKLIKSALGGYLLIRYEDDGNYLDYYAALPLTNTQSVEFAENLLDLSSETDGTNIYTAILPEGKDGLTIEALSDGDLTDDLVKSGLTIYSKSGVATYGRITRHIKWDDVTVAANLQTKAKAALADNGLSMPETITCKAVDLGWQDGIQHFRVGRMTAIFSTPHGYSTSYPLMELAPDILDPGNTQITLGATQQTYTGAQIDAKRETDKRIESTRQEISERVDESSSQVIQATHQQITDLQQNVNSIILSALENYVETGDFDSYKEEVSTKLSVLTDQLSIDITKVTERIDKVDGDLQSKYSEITKAFRFTSDGLIIGETGNEILLRLDNDVLQFVRNNTPELQITAEGVEAMRIKVSILCIGNVVWTEDENDDVIAS
uniref:phage tail protein n=1 Tax=Faecalibacterium prausnitzii TaxID=853 RepID=UPI004028CED3